jgi:tetratricopeptide (TPR) repeat protein
MILMLLLAASLLSNGGPKPAMAAAQPPAHRPDMEYYLNRVAVVEADGFLKNEIRRFRSYPHLDRAYRLQRGRRLQEAVREFEEYLSLNPDDIRSRVSYLNLLDQLSLNQEVIAQADVILDRWPAFIPAYFYKGLAFQKLGQPDRALAVFSSAASGQDVLKEDRTYALSTAVDLAVSLQNYEVAGSKLTILMGIEKRYSWLMQAGYVFEKRGRLNESMDAYDDARKNAATDGEKAAASLALAEVARKLNLPERARQAYESAVESDSGNQAALRGLAHLAYHGKRLDEAEKWMLLLKRTGFTPEDRQFLANLYLLKKNYSAAIQELRVSVGSQGKKASAWNLTALAQAYEAAGRWQESAAIYRLLLEKSPESAEIQLRYGNLLLRMGRVGEAAPFFKKALLLGLPARQKAVAHRNLSLVSEKSGNFENAAEELEKSMEYEPASGAAERVRLALLLNRAGKAKEALRYLDQALADPALTDDLKRVSHREKSLIFEKAGQTSRAVDELEKALLLSGKGDTETIVRLALLLHAAGKPAEALRRLDQALAEKTLSNDLKRVVFREKGLLLEQAGKPLEAAHQYEKAVALGDNSPGINLVLANLYQSGQDPNSALGYFTRVVSHPEASNQEKCSAEEGCGMIFFKQGRLQEASDHYSAALQRCGESWQRRYSLGLVRYRSKEWQQALEQFLLAEKLKRDPASLMGIALCHKELGRPGAAVHYLQLALGEPGARPEMLQQIHESLGYLYAEEFANDKAAEAFARAQAIDPDPIVAMKLANVLTLAGKNEQAWKALNGVEAGTLSAADTIEYNDLKSGLLQKSGRNQEALAIMEKTQKLQATASRSYALGLLYQKTGQPDKAIEQFQAANAKEPQQDDYALALGYAYLADGRFGDAIGIFELLAARNPDSQKVLEQLGYLNSKTGKNEQAVEWFKKSLDSLPVMPLGVSEETDRRDKDAHRIRSEISKLTKTFKGALYASYRAGSAPSSFLANGELTSGGLNGQVGLEASYRPPLIGLRDERILELTGRVFGSLNPDSLDYNHDSTQAGVGLRYKFLPGENLWISGERLIGVGKDALDDWLVRLLYSRGTGFEPLPFERNRDYYLLYGEIDGYLSNEIVAAYGEARKGRAFTLRSDFLLAPYIVLDARWQSPYSTGGNYLEGGAGISLKYFFNSTHYENYRNLFDFSINYKHGKFFNSGSQDTSGDYDSSLISIGFFF